jgi:hypothetical protein
MGITFMTLRRRSPAILREVANTPRSDWHTVHLDVPHRMYRTPKVIDQQVSWRDYEGPIRQGPIAGLGHEEPTVLLTNDLRTPAAQRITRYAQRMLIGNGLAHAVKFVHRDALSLRGPPEDPLRRNVDRSGERAVSDAGPKDRRI